MVLCTVADGGAAVVAAGPIAAAAERLCSGGCRDHRAEVDYPPTRLLPGRPLGAAVATGVIWGIWHYPILLMGYNFPVHRLAGPGVFTVSTVMLSIIFGWLLDRSGSIWAPSLGHAALNTVG